MYKCPSLSLATRERKMGSILKDCKFIFRVHAHVIYTVMSKHNREEEQIIVGLELWRLSD